MDLVPSNTTPYTLWISAAMEDNQILKAKKYLLDTFGNVYYSEPHISLLIFPISILKFKSLAAELNDVFNMSSIRANIGNLSYEEKRRFFQLDINGEQLLSIHLKLLEIGKKFSENKFRHKDFERLSQDYFTENELRMLKLHGYHQCDKTFASHITLGNIVNNLDNFNLSDTTDKLEDMVETKTNRDITLTHIVADVFYDSIDQRNYKSLWKWSKHLTA
jgi:hypothetical protein